MKRIGISVALFALIAMAWAPPTVAESDAEEDLVPAPATAAVETSPETVDPAALDTESCALTPATGAKETKSFGFGGDCRCGPPQETPIRNADVPESCAAATNLLRSVLRNHVSCFEGVCQETLVITRPCVLHEGRYWVEGLIRYRCNICR